MRNPSRKPQLPLWREIVATISLSLGNGGDVRGNMRKATFRWIAGGLLCMALAVGISLVALARERSAKKEAGPEAGSNAESKAEPATTKLRKRSGAAKAESARTATKEGAEEKTPSEGGSKNEKDASESQEHPAQDSPANERAERREEEGPELVRARAAWFHDQRAYPFQHIPEGVLEKAIQQRDAMKARQRLAAGPQSGANSILSFPGDALWHLMGPQPVNNQFGFNGGFPTASGRVTAIAVDPTTASTVYIGGAAGGVWKTTDSGAHWTPLTDSQPSLAVGAIAIDPNNHLTIYVGTGEQNFNGDAYYGVGVLKSTDGGNTWTQSGSPFAGALTSTFGGAKIGAIAVQPGNSSIVLAAAYFFDGNDPRGGIYRSTDGGATWVLPTTGAQGSAGTAVVFDPAGSATTTATVYAALGDIFSGASANGIWKSTDSGTNWTKLAGGLPTTNVGRITLGYAPGTTGATATIYAAIADSSSSSSNLLGLFKTTNGGTSWSTLTGPAVTNGFCATQCFYDMAIGVQPTSANVVVVGGGPGPDNFTSLFESQDGGSTWTPSGPFGSPAPGNFANGSTTTHVHVDTHAIVFTPNGGTLFVGDDGGIWSTTTPTPAAGVSPTWSDLNTGVAITQFYPGISAGISDENYGFGGTQDNDTELFSGSLQWDNLFACGDGGFTAIDPGTPTTVYTGCDKFASPLVQKSVFNGAIINGPNPSFGAPFAGPNSTFNPADTGIANETMEFIPPLTIDGNNSNTLYFGTCHLYQTNDSATTWTAITGDLSGTNAPGACGGAGDITTMDVSHQSSGIVVAGTSNGKVWETLSATAGPASTWTEIDNGKLPQRHITAVRTLRSDSTGNVVYATLSGFGACAGCGATPGHVFVTTNATSGAPTWTNISGDLPDMPVNDLIVDHSGNPPFDALYIGTDVGVFSCPNPAGTLCANWTVVGDGLPNSPVLGIAMRSASRILRAATHGRSMWDIQLTDQNPPAIAFLSSLTPAAAKVGDSNTAVTVTGANFSANTLVLFDGVSVGTPTFVSTTQLTVSVNSSLLTAGHVFQVSLSDPQGADTSSIPFAVMNPILTATNMTPNNTTAYTPVTLIFTGTNFISTVNAAQGTQVSFNNIPLSGGTASAGGTSFSVQVPTFLLTTTGPATVTITNPVPGGGPTPGVSFPFTINPGTIVINPSPIVLVAALGTTSTPVTNVQVINSSASSASITAQSITGTNAVNFSFAAPTIPPTCNFPTSGQSGTGTITLAANGGTCNFGITYTAATPPGNAVSNATLSVTDNASGSPQTAPINGTPLPAAVLLAPVSFGAVTVGTTSTMNATLSNFSGSSINVTSAFSVTGTNHADFSIVPFIANGDGNSVCPTTLPFPLASGASCDVSLGFSPSLPAGNETAQLNVTASVAVTTSTPNLIGTGIEITSISPSIVATGGPAFTLTVNGGGFAPSAVVNVGPNGTNPRPTTFISANQLQASIPASDIATAGTLPISVTSPNPGGTASEPKTLFIAQARSANNDNINFAKTPNFGSSTIRTTSGPFTGGSTGITLTWSTPFPDTNYTAVCTAETVPGDFLLPTITLRTATAITVVPTDGGTSAGVFSCIAIPDSDTSDIRRGRVAYSSAPGTPVTVTWNTAFADTTYVAACTVETQGSTAAGFTSVISSLTTSSVAVDNNGFATGTMHCIGVPSTDRSAVRRGKAAISGSPATVTVNWNVGFNNTTTSALNYAAVCSDVEAGVTSSGAALAISMGSKTDSGLTIINEIPSGTLHCLAVPFGDTAALRVTEDTTQATAQLAAITSPATPATPIDPTPACAPAGAAAQGRAKSVWWNWTAPANGTIVADTRFSSYPTILSVWTLSTPLPSSTETFTAAACQSGNVPPAGSSPIESLVSFNVTSGSTYFFMVSDATSTGAGGTLTFAADFESVAPANDDNAASTTITPAQLPYSNAENTILATPNTNAHNDPTPPCAPGGAASGGMANSVWYTFTPSSNGTVVADTLTSPYETILNVTSGSPTGTQVACNQSAAAGIAQSQVSFAATSGTAYFFMISSVLGDGGTTNFHLNFTAGGVGAATKLAFTVQPSNVAAGASISPAVQVAVQDASGNTVTTATNSVTIAIGTNPSGGTLGGTATLAAVNGIATFSNLSINKTGTGYTLAASATGLTGAASNAFNVTASAASKLVFGVQPGNVAAGASISPAVQVTLQDAQGNTVTSATNSITMAIGTNPSSGTLAGTTTVAAVSGVATFSNLSINKTGTGYTLAASATSLTGATSSAFNVTPGTATKLAFTVQPSNVGSGAPITPAVQVTIQDALGNTVTSATNTITMAIGTNPGGGTLSGAASVAAVSGVATFSNLSINNAGTGYTLTASATGLTGATSNAFNVTSGTAAKLAFTAQPSNVAAGASITPSVQVTIEDSSGNPITTATNSVTIAIGTNPSGGTLGGTTTVAAVNGVATFSSLNINSAGNGYTLAASSSGLTGTTSSAFNVTPGTATKLAFTVQPSNVAAGASITPSVQVTVQDAQGNTVTSATNSITMAIGTNPSSGTLAGTTTVAAVSGVATFSNLSINKTGTGYTLAASATSLTGATSNAFNVTAGAAAKLAFTVQPTNVAAGASISPSVQVTVQDAQGNTVTSATNSITMAIGTNPSGGALAGTTTVAAVSGVATFSNLSINKTGTGYTLAASAASLTGATSSAFNVTAGAAAKLAFMVQPTNVAAGASISPSVQVTVQDAQGNTVTSATNSITIAIGTNPGGGTLSGTATASAVAGVATFSNLSINFAGAGYTLSANATGLTSAASSAFTVSSAAAAKNVFTVQPSSAGAGSVISPPVQVTVEDTFGNTVTTATNSITIAIGTNPSAGTLSGTATVAAVNGVATFSNLSINAAANGYTLTASATGLTSATSNAFNITSGTPAKLAFTAQPSNVGSGAAITPPVQVTIEDAQGNPVTTATNSVTIAIGTNPSGGTLAGTATVSAVNGVATFSNLSINNLGTGYTLTASATGLTGATSNAFNVTAGAPAKVVFTVQPSSVTAGVAIAPAVQVSIEDAGGNVVTTATNSVAIAIGTNPSSGTLAGTATVAAVNGIATFSTLSINNAGTGYTLTASATGLTGATSSAFNVVAGAPAKLAFTVQPSNVGSGAAISPAVQVSIEDAQGNLVTTATNSITIAIGTNPSAGTLSGTTTVVAVNGVASFSALSIDKAGPGYTLAASSTGLTGAGSSMFNVTAGAAAKLSFTTQPTNVAAGASISPAVQVSVQDASGNTVTAATNSITIAIGTNPSGGTLSGTATVAAVNGVASFPNLNIDKIGVGYTLAASATGLTGTTSAAFNVTVGAAAKLAFTVQPSNVMAGIAIAPPVQVTVEDAGGNVVTTATNAVTIAIGTNPGTGTLSGTATTNAASGLSTFSTLSINKAGTGYTLTASAAGLTGATSAAFNVTAGPAAKVTATSGTPQNAVIGTAFANPLVATVTDANANPVSGVLVTFTPPGSGASGTFAGGQNTATTSASGVATSAVFTANATAGGPYNVVASAVGATSANFSLTNNNPVPAITPPLSPASASAGGVAFALTINGTNFVAGATVTFGSNPAITPTSITSTQIVVTIPAADFATGGTPNVTVTNPAPGGGASNTVAFTVNNPVPTVASANAAGKSHAPGGASFTLTVNGTNFVSTSVINFIVGAGTPKAEPTTYVSATQLTAAIPASDVSSAGTASITVTNPSPGGGTTTANTTFTVDGYTVVGPATPPSVKAGQPASIQFTVTPTANGFANAVTFSVSGLPAHSGPPTFTPSSVTPGSTTQMVTLSIPTTARGAAPPTAPTDPPTAPLLRLLPWLWLATLLAAAYASRLARRVPQLRRYAALLPLVLLLITGAALAGCIGGKSGTPAGPAALTITATSGTMSQTTNVTLTVN